MASRNDEALDRFLLPGESIVQRYRKVRAARKFSAILTDRRILLVGRNAYEEIHLSAIASMGYGSSRRDDFISGGIVLVGLGLVTMIVSYLWSAIGTWLIFLGIVLIALGVVLKRRVVRVSAGGQNFNFVGTSANLLEFIRDARLQQSRFSGFMREGQEFRLPQASSVPIAVNVSPGGQREVIREIVKVRCRNCGTLGDLASERCPSCGSPL